MRYLWFGIRIKHLLVWDWYTSSDFLLFWLDPMFPLNVRLGTKANIRNLIYGYEKISSAYSPSPIDTLFFIKNHMFLWSVGGFISLLKHVCILVKEHRDYLVSREQELCRSEFLITNWGCVGAKAPLLSTTPPFAVQRPESPVACRDTLRLSTPRHLKIPSLIDK